MGVPESTWQRTGNVTFSGSATFNRGNSTYTINSTTETEVNRGLIIGLLGGDVATVNVSHDALVGGVLTNFNAVAATLGDAAGSTGTLNMNAGTLNFTGSDFTQSTFIIGNNGNGTLGVNSGGDVTVPFSNSQLVLGNHATGFGTATISGTGSTMTVANELWIGGTGDGNLTVQNGGELITTGTGGTASAIIGTFNGSDSMVTIKGEGSKWRNNARLTVGNSGNGSLLITGGGELITDALTSTPAVIGSGSNVTGSVTVTGSGSTWNTNSQIRIGEFGKGSLAILSGGSLTSASAVLLGRDGGSGHVLVAGPNSTWGITTGPLTIGGFSTSETSVTINPGGTVNVTGDINIGGGGLLKLQGGTLVAGSINPTGGEFQWTSGTLSTSTYNGSLTNMGGTLSPGQSIGGTAVFGNFHQGAGTAMDLEISSPTFPGSFPERDFVSVDGQADLDGLLQLTLIDGFIPTGEEDPFAVLSAGSLTGEFDNVLSGQRLATSDGLGSFQVHYGTGSAFDPNQVVLSNFLASATLPGDFDNDGDVDGRDFLVWQRNPSVGNLADWQANYNARLLAITTGVGDDPARSSAVPEPGGLLLLVISSTCGNLSNICRRFAASADRMSETA